MLFINIEEIERSTLLVQIIKNADIKIFSIDGRGNTEDFLAFKYAGPSFINGLLSSALEIMP